MNKSLISIGLSLGLSLCAIAGEWSYSIENGGAKITSAPYDLSGAVTVPSQLGGCPVVSIGDWVGQSNDEVTSLTIPDSVTNIGRYAFANCGKLKSVTIGPNVWEMGAAAFSGTPLMEVEGDKREIAYIGNWAMGFKTCLVDDARQISSEDFYVDFMDVRKIDIVLDAGVKHIADDAFYSVHFKTKGSSWEWDNEYTIPYGKIALPEGLLTIGAGAFSTTFYPGTYRADDLIVPASVVEIGAQSFSGLIDRQICFAGSRPAATGNPFSQEHYYGGDDISIVYYLSGASGWTYGAEWRGVRTYPFTWLERRSSRITLGSVYEYDSDADEHEIQERQEIEDDEYIAIPVYGASSAAEINPVVLHHTSSAIDIASIEVRTDAQMFSAIVQPLLKYKNQWFSYSNGYDSYYYIHTSQAEGSWPKSLWPDDKAVSGRFWIIITPNSGTRYDTRDFRVGLFGTDEVTDRIYLSNTAWGPRVTDKLCLDTKRITYGGRSAPHIGYGQSCFPEDGAKGDALGKTTFWTQGVNPASFTATVSEPGMFVLAVNDYDCDWNENTQTGTYIGDNYKSQMMVTGGSITNDSEGCHWDKIDGALRMEWPDYDDYEDYDDYLRTADECESAQRAILDVAYTNMYWRHGGGACVRRIVVGKAGTYTFASKKHEDIDANRLHFFPANCRSVAVDAICMTTRKYGGQYGRGNAYGYVQGSGVYAVGENVTFTAVPVFDNQFDHWEVAYADNYGELSTALRDKSMTSPMLSFAVTDAMCGGMTEEKQIVLRAVWKEKRVPEIIPSPVGAATVGGNKPIFEGENVTVTLTPAKNCLFTRWIDDAACGLTRTFSYEESGSDEPMYAIFSGTPVNPVPHLEIENLADSYAVNNAIDPVAVGVASGTGYTVKVSGLPAGLSFANGRITGTPTKTGSYSVTATATKSGVATLTETFILLVTYRFRYTDNGDGTVTLTGVIGTPSGAFEIPSFYADMTVVAIGDGFLNDCGGITSVTIPATLTHIAEGSIQCPSCKNVTVAVGNPRYCIVDGLLYDYVDGVVISRANSTQKKFTIPDGAVRIANIAFARCSNVEVTIPSSVTSIGCRAFCECSGLTVNILGEEPEIDDCWDEENQTWDYKHLFIGSTNVKVYVQPGQRWENVPGTWQYVPIEYPTGAVAYWAKPNEEDGGVVLMGVKSGAPSGTLFLPATYDGQTVTAIGDIIYKNSKLTKVVFPSTIKKITGSGIESCSALTEVVLNEGLEEIGEDAFLNCGITSFTIPSTVTSIGAGAFGQNPLKKIEVDPDNERYYVTANGLLIDGYDEKIQLSVRDQGALVIPEGIEVIGSLAFEHVKLTSVKFPQSLREVESCSFCSDIGFPLTELDFSQTKLERVGSAAFICGTSLKTVRFPSTLQEIGYWAFNRCTSLSTVYFAGGIPEITEDSWITETAQNEMPKLWETYPDGDLYVAGSETEATRLKNVMTYVTPGNGWEDVCASGTWQGRPIKMKTSVSVTADGTGGTITGGGSYDSGAKITLKAMPAKGYVFAGWYENGEPLTGIIADYRAQSIAYTVPARNVSLVAKFILASDDHAEIAFTMPDESATGTPIKPIAVDVSGCMSLPTVKVTGLPAGLKFTAKALDVKATKTVAVAHYEANTIYGTPTKSGVYTVVASVTTAGKKTATKTVTVVVIDRAKGESFLKIESDSAMGKVTGAGIYAAGKKVTLKATANAAKKATKTTSAQEATVFAGWYADPDFKTPLAGTVDFRTPSFAYTMPAADTTVYARFVLASEDRNILLFVDGREATTTATDTVINTSGDLMLALEAESVTLPKIAVSGLPAGLKFTNKQILNKDKSVAVEANTIYGTTTKPGTYVVTAKLANTTVKKAIEKKFTIIVDNLTAANGCFREAIANGRDEKYVISAGVTAYDLPSLKLSSAGTLKVSGLPTGLKYDGANAKITGVATKAGTYTVTLTVGKLVSTMTIQVDSLPDWVVGSFEGYGYDQYFGDGDEWMPSPAGHWSGRAQASISAAGKVSAVLTYGKTRRSNAQLKCRRGDVYEFEMEGTNISIECREINGIRVGYMSAKWAHTNEWNEHIVTEVNGWQLRWQELAKQGLVPTFSAKTETKLLMSDLKYDEQPTADPQLTLPGSLALKYGKNGALTVAYSTTQGGKATATVSAQLVPVEMNGNGRLRMETTVLIKLMKDGYFALHLFLSSPVGTQPVYGDDVIVEDYLLTAPDQLFVK